MESFIFGHFTGEDSDKRDRKWEEDEGSRIEIWIQPEPDYGHLHISTTSVLMLDVQCWIHGFFFVSI